MLYFNCIANDFLLIGGSWRLLVIQSVPFLFHAPLDVTRFVH